MGRQRTNELYFGSWLLDSLIMYYRLACLFSQLLVMVNRVSGAVSGYNSDTTART